MSANWLEQQANKIKNAVDASLQISASPRHTGLTPLKQKQRQDDGSTALLADSDEELRVPEEDAQAFSKSQCTILGGMMNDSMGIFMRGFDERLQGQDQRLKTIEEGIVTNSKRRDEQYKLQQQRLGSIEKEQTTSATDIVRRRI